LSSHDAARPGDQARASVLVRVAAAEAFRVFTEEIDQWWRRGFRYRVGGVGGTLRLEPHPGGRLFESFTTPAGTRVVETGRVTGWEPPSRLVLEWRAANFAPAEKTEVEVSFDERPNGTLVIVTHRGWSAIRPDHPVRHGEATAAFLRTMGMWWGELLGALREHSVRRP
jgi:uncharacterized protein YndB with AHSA1/START domain